jgi:3'-phosphoadenosine 5'-phosphosulfate sulfotransferase (PAPS reductase)/FAD synthetase
MRNGFADVLVALCAAGALAASIVAATAQAMRLDGHWVVLTSIKDDGGQRPHREMEAFRKTMLGCKVEIFNDFSSKFVGFTPGYLVAVTGAYRTEAEARAQLPKVRPCAPNAYVKKARHMGE